MRNNTHSFIVRIWYEAADMLNGTSPGDLVSLLIHSLIPNTNNTHSFIVRIWYEAVDDQGNAITWRGSVEHVGSGRRLHFQKLDEFVDFHHRLTHQTSCNVEKNDQTAHTFSR